MYRPITSRENSIFKQLRKLKRKKYRDRESRYLIEGENLICEALDNEECMEEIILREDVALKFEAIADETSVPVYTLPPELFDDVADTETCQGILAVVKKQIYNIKDMVNLCGAGTNLVIDIIFSIDSILTAVGMTNGLNGALYLMIIAVVLSVAIMMLFANPVSNFSVDRKSVV